MPAVVVHAAGDLRVDEREAPTPGPGEVSVAIEMGGICGSDLHYVTHGGMGDIRLRMPMVLGHEVVGRIAALGDGVDGLAVGEAVAVHPARACGRCEQCVAGRPNLCAETRFFGSAMRFPHVDGGFAGRVVVSAAQAIPVPDGVPPERSVFAEPLAVGIHALHRAGDVAGRRVLITGAGPIGSLAVIAARAARAAHIVVTDLVDEALAVARSVGADETINVADGAAPPEVDVALEMSGAPAGIATCIRALSRAGTLVLVGLPGGSEVPAPLGTVITRELDVRGSFRYGVEFEEAVAMIAAGAPVDELRSGVFGLDRVHEAFELAPDRRRATKVLLDFRQP